ncbi:MAG: ketoacyl-ACP synthase III [Chloroflexi bacterium]|nr:ketoacyl-ACP synthase III [Chloroflexota bacterium]
MRTLTPAGIAGTGSFLPERVVTNDDFARTVDTSDEWIVKRTGIRERRFVADDQQNSDLAIGAAQRALEAAGLAPEELDLIVVGTLTADHLMPSVACQVQDRLGATKAGAFDVQSACTGFLTALHTAEAFVAAGRAKNVLVIGTEALSRYLDMSDRTSCILFGDGAGAAVVRPLADCGGQGEILRTTLGADGGGFEFIHIPHGGTKFPHNHAAYVASQHFIGLKGREVYRFAVSKMSSLITEMAAGFDPDEIGLIVPHQVNMRIIESAMARVGWGMDRTFINIDKYGNTSAASVPIALDEAYRAGKLEKGKLVVMVAFGAGLTWGASLMRW